MKKYILLLSLFVFSFTQAQIVNIPDANFKQALLDHNPIIDTNDNGEIEVFEVANVPLLDVSNQEINSLTGIEVFTNLVHLDCSSNELTTIDISNNLQLVHLYCFANQLTSLNVASNVNLKYLYCYMNPLNALDVSQNTALIHLNCFANQLTTLDVNTNIDLIKLWCFENEITTLDLSNNINLDEFYCHNNQLSALDLSSNINLVRFGCMNNNMITTLDLSNNTELITLNCGDNTGLTYINLKNGNNNNLNLLGDFSSDFENLPNLEAVCVDELNTDLTSFIETEVGHTVNFTEDCTLSIHQKFLLDFTIYPIPAQNILHIDSKTDILTVEIYNKLGRLVLKNNAAKNINISQLNPDLYFVKIQDVKGNFGVKKLIKE